MAIIPTTLLAWPSRNENQLLQERTRQSDDDRLKASDPTRPDPGHRNRNRTSNKKQETDQGRESQMAVRLDMIDMYVSSGTSQDPISHLINCLSLTPGTLMNAAN